MKFFGTICLLILCAAAGLTVQAQADLGAQLNGTTSSAQLELSANVQTALVVELDLSRNALVTTATANDEKGGNRLSGSGIFHIDFGNVNGLGVGAPRAGVNVDVRPDGALYTVPVTMTVRYSGFGAANNASFLVKLDPAAGNETGRRAVREGPGAQTALAPGSAEGQVFAAASDSGATLTRQVGLFISNDNGPEAMRGGVNARLIYQAIVPTP